MVLNKYRDTGDRIFGPWAHRLKNLHPNTLTWLSVVCALVAGLAFAFADLWPIDLWGRTFHWLLPVAVSGVALNGALDALDGKVARISGRESRRGDYLDHVMDRVSDVIIMGGIMLGPFCDTLIGALAIIVTLLVSYMGTQAQAVGCGRNYGGAMGRADRILMLMAVPVLQMFWNARHPTGAIEQIDLTLLELMMLVFIVTGIATIISRGRASWRELGEMDRGAGGKKGGKGSKGTGGGNKGGKGGKGTRGGKEGGKGGKGTRLTKRERKGSSEAKGEGGGKRGTT